MFDPDRLPEPLGTSGRGLYLIAQLMDDMLLHTDTAESPWWVIESDDKKRTRLNCINDLLGRIPYKNSLPPAKKLPKRKAPTKNSGRVPFGSQRLIELRF